jgi:hypothetical protein
MQLLSSRMTSRALLTTGIVFRIWQYLGHASLWVDEIKLAQNITATPISRLLTEPLAQQQVAPPGFLLLEKLSVLGLGSSDLALRLVPLLASIAALFLFWHVAGRVVEGAPLLMARGLFAIGFPFVFYGSEVKQYSSDIAIALGLTLAAMTLLNDRRRRVSVIAALAGALAVWFSQPAVLVLAGVGGALVVLRVLEPAEVRGVRLAPVLAAWGLAAVAATGAAFRVISPDTQAFMHAYWRSDYLPLPPRDLMQAVWPIERLGSLFGPSGLDYAWPALQLPIAVLGFAALYRRRRAFTLLLLGPLVVAFGAAILHLYPFAGRLVSFSLPSLVVGFCTGIEALVAMLRGWSPRLPVPARLALLAPAILPVVSAPPVYRPEESEPVVEYVGSHRRPMDGVYVFFQAASAVTYYGPRHGLVQRDLLVGGCHRDDRRGYMRELDRFRGRPRLWLVFSHAQPGDPDRRQILAYLKQIGTEELDLEMPAKLPEQQATGAAAYLFDFADPRRLSATTAETAPLMAETVAPLHCSVRSS